MARKSHKRRSSKRGRPCRGRNRSAARKSRRCRTSRKTGRGRRHTKARGYKRKASKRHGRHSRKASRRNPGMERSLKDGSTVTLDEYGTHQGIVRVHTPDGSMRDYKLSWPKALKRYYAIKSGSTAKKHASKEDWAMLAHDNPRRRSKRTRRNCGMTQDPRWATTRIIRKGAKGHNPRGRKVYRPRGRNSWSYGRNPAQFPMPFVSAMNPRISRKEARGMGRVLRRHGYKRCKV